MRVCVHMCPSTFWVSQDPPPHLPGHLPSEEKPPLRGLLGQVLPPIDGPSLEGRMEGGIEGAHPWGASIIPPPAHLGGLGGIPPSATAIPVTHCRGEPGALLFASADDPLPELEGHVGDVAGAGDGGGMERCQVRGRDGGPARSLEIDGHQFFFHQHNKGTGVLKAWGGGRWLLLAETPPTTTTTRSVGPPQQNVPPSAASALCTVKKSMTREVKSSVARVWPCSTLTQCRSP